jgi:Uma2 family endonuclease
MSAGARQTSIIPLDEVPVDRFYRLSVDQYLRMTTVGILTKDDRVEMLDGIIYFKHPASYETSEQFYRLSVDQYHAMIEAGILTSDDPVELLEGWLIRTMPINPPHRRASERTFAALTRIVPVGWYVTMHQPITLDDSEREPDLAIVRGSTDDYPDRHPGPADLGLVIEVSHSTLPSDRVAKKLLYARSGIRFYWIINLVDRQVEALSNLDNSADAPDYQRHEAYGPDAEAPVVLDGREVGRIAVRDILP